MAQQKPHLEADLLLPRQERSRGQRRWRAFGLLLSSFIVGVLAWNGFTAGMAATNTERFCLSCHEMETNAYAEYEDTSHDRNAAGVRAICADCHVPTSMWPKLVAKVNAASDVYHHLLGTIDTREKYRDRRLHMAEAVWHYMQSSDSRECRSCHTQEKMDLEAQDGRAARKHEAMAAQQQTCIDCHKGIAHALPEGYDAESL